MNNEYPPIQNVDLTEQTYRILRDQILRRHIQPGEKIIVDRVTEGLKVSRTPVINALKMLENEGLVEVIPRRGTYVTEVRDSDIKEIFEIRLMVELYAAELAFNTGKSGHLLADLAGPFDRMKGAVSDEAYLDYELFIASDRDFHTKLVEAAGNQRLLVIYSNLNVHIQVTRAHYRHTVEEAQEAKKEHAAMIKALEDSDWESFRKALTLHITKVKDRLLEIR